MAKKKKNFIKEFAQDIARNWTSIDTILGFCGGLILMFILGQVYEGKSIAPFIIPIFQIFVMIYCLNWMIDLASRRRRQDYPEKLGGWDFANMNLFTIVLSVIAIMMAASLAPQGVELFKSFKMIVKLFN